MLSREQALEELKRYQGDPLGRVTANHRMFESPTVDKLEAWLKDQRTGNPRALAAELDTLSARKLEKVFTAFAPALGESLAHWWIWAQRAPYQAGWLRRGFRSSRVADSQLTRLQQLLPYLRLASRWPQDAAWFAAWCSHVDHGTLGPLFASEISRGRKQVADTLVSSAFGQHPISGITRSGLGALVASDDHQCWGSVATLLLNAGRQEGLRSAVLEAADLAQPGALAFMIDAVIEADLTRFAGTVRAVGVWFGETLEIRQATALQRLLPRFAAELKRSTIESAPPTDPIDLFLGLSALAMHDVHRAIPIAARFVHSQDTEVRRAAARTLAEFGLPDARAALRSCLSDSSLAVYATAVSAWPTNTFARDLDAQLAESDVAVLLDRVRTLGKPAEFDTGLIGTRTVTIGAAQAADVILANLNVTAAPAEALAAASAQGRQGAARRLALDPRANRAALFGLLSDASSAVRSTAFDALRSLPEISATEAALLEDALRRKAADLRRIAITLLLRQTRTAIATSVDRLASGNVDQARAAIELAREAGLPGPTVAAATGDSPASSTSGEPISAPSPRVAISVSTAEEEGIPAQLRFRVSDRTPALKPAPIPTTRFASYHDGCRRIVTSLRGWLAEHSDTEVDTPTGVQLLSNIRWLGSPPAGSALPLPQVIEPWWERIEPSLTDGGLELILLLAVAASNGSLGWARGAQASVVGEIPPDRNASPLTWAIIGQLANLKARSTWADPALDALSVMVAALPLDGLLGPAEVLARRGRRVEVDQWGNLRAGADPRAAIQDITRFFPIINLNAVQMDRLWRLARYIDEPEGTFDVFDGEIIDVTPARTFGRMNLVRKTSPDQPHRRRPGAELTARAVEMGIAHRADLLDALLDIGVNGQYPMASLGGRSGTGIGPFTARRPQEWATTPAVRPVVDEVRAAAIDAEVRRGDLPGPLSHVAHQLRSAQGIPSLTRVLASLGSRPFIRGYSWTDSRESSLSRLARIHIPGAGDTAEELGREFTQARIKPKRAVELGVYAPQWASLIEEHLEWPGFESAVWWLHAHTNDNSWTVDPQIREEWTSAVSQRTPLDSVDLTRGAADVAWFRDVIATLGEERFGTLLAAAKYASSSSGHKRAELFATALLGRIDEATLLERIKAKRHQDSVRALGLLPLAGPDDTALLSRYELLRGFVASDRTSGSQRRASEQTAVTIGLENLARSAGYADPQRLTWAMEAAAVRDLVIGPITAIDGDVTVSLSIDTAGVPILATDKAGKALKSIPAKSAKVEAIAELKARASSLRKQASRMRQSLEQSCVSGDSFETREFDELSSHPIIAPMLRDLVVVTSEGVIGLPGADARNLIGPDGSVRPTDGSALRIAHPVDLLASGEWADFQHAAFSSQRTQPFRQLFRELYIPTAQEIDDGPTSRRYAGHQVESGRARGIFTSRGWVADFEVGFGRTFHREKLTAWCSLMGGFGTAAEVEDATIEDVTFCRAGKWEPVPIREIPPRLFSETMRDLDLVVSVAHAGGVDPETSESSIEMRSRLVEETTALLGLTNVEVGGHHARIRGKLGTYSVQLGSGQVHRIPGNAVCIIPVSAQHRRRIFLPFADDDPRTAEVISKVITLARDDKIQDPTILEQLV